VANFFPSFFCKKYERSGEKAAFLPHSFLQQHVYKLITKNHFVHIFRAPLLGVAARRSNFLPTREDFSADVTPDGQLPYSFAEA
jgi:hypothetical protein